MTSGALTTPPALTERGYTVLERIGQGGQGQTVKARRNADGTLVVIKTLLLANVDNWKAVELFEREAKTLEALDMDGVPRLIEYVNDEAEDGSPRFYLVQELIEGHTVLSLIERGHQFGEGDAVGLAIQVLQILDQLHNRTPPIIHRDIKPSNIIIRPDGRPALVDFGAVAANLQSDAQNASEGATVAGTFGYMAPEQFRGAASPASDIYGLGATLVHLLSHIPPNQMETHGLELAFQRHLRTSPHFINLLEHFLIADETLRIPTAQDAIHALQTYNTLPEAEAHGALVQVAKDLGELQYTGQPGYMELFNALPRAPRDMPPAYISAFKTRSLLVFGGSAAALVTILVGGFAFLSTAGGVELALVALILPFVFAYTFAKSMFIARKLITKGRKAVGTVTALFPRESKTEVRYEFSADGKYCAGQCYIKNKQVSLQLGNAVGVLYDPAKPDTHNMIYPVPSGSVIAVFSE